VIQPQAADIKKPFWRRAIPAVVGLVAGAVIAGFAVWYFKPSPPAIVTRFSFTLPEGQQFTNTGTQQLIAISPDGTQFVYVANQRLYLKSMRELNPIPIQGTEFPAGIDKAAFSPDSRSLAFYSAADQTVK